MTKIPNLKQFFQNLVHLKYIGLINNNIDDKGIEHFS
jgi:hypothetical protein